ncbi:MAG: DUF4129 domain-containing protein [Thermofilum sp.]|jgi:hypothetical protein|nr:DUF4129 domain-containing protein [Thermofilum sp.]
MKRYNHVIKVFLYVLLLFLVSSYQESEFQLRETSVGEVFSWLAYLFLGLLSIVVVFYRRVIVKVLLEVLRMKTKVERYPLNRREPLWELLVLLAMLPVLLAVLNEKGRQAGGNETFAFPGNVAGLANSSRPALSMPANASAAKLNITTYLPQPPILLVLAVFSCVVLLALLVGYFELQREMRESGNDVLQKEVKTEVETALKRLEGKEGDLRHEIVRLYNSFCRAIEVRGVKLEKFWTAREIMVVIAHLVPVLPRNAVEELTSLFELALYSNHPLSEEHRRLAVGALNKIFLALSILEGATGT